MPTTLALDGADADNYIMAQRGIVRPQVGQSLLSITPTAGALGEPRVLLRSDKTIRGYIDTANIMT